MTVNPSKDSSIQTSRRALLSAAGLTGVSALLSATAPAAYAEPAQGLQGAVAKFFFPKEGFNAPDAPFPTGVKLESEDMKQALAVIKQYAGFLKDTSASFSSDPLNYDVVSPLRNTIKIDTLRDSLNSVNEAFDEETQKTTDKVVRSIIQDIGEIETNSALRGKERTPKKVERTKQWLAKINDDFDRLISFYE